MNNNTILLLALCILLVLTGCYLLLLAPDYYTGGAEFRTLDEYNEYCLIAGKEPIYKSFPIHIGTDIVLPRNQRSQGYPYGEISSLGNTIGFSSLGVVLIALGCLIYEYKRRELKQR